MYYKYVNIYKKWVIQYTCIKIFTCSQTRNSTGKHTRTRTHTRVHTRNRTYTQTHTVYVLRERYT
jgi:hypothetical protein